MRKALILILALVLFPAVASAATVRALFVGVDKYRFSKTSVQAADFNDLRGAVGDTLRIKSALRTIYKLDLDTPPSGLCTSAGAGLEDPCAVRAPFLAALQARIVKSALGATTLPSADACLSANAVSITLTDLCATRAYILAALEDRIARSAPGDTVLFYYAGHGSQYPDDEVQDQATGFDGTIMPTDARDPDAVARADILDRELRGYKERAMAAGVNFVTIFDSCNSGSATRDGAAGVPRSAPKLTVKPPVRPKPPPPSGPGGGYWVHFAAADDGEQAQEIPLPGAVGARAGVYTSALIEALTAMPDAAFADLEREAALRLVEHGALTQNPRAEGTGLNASFGGGAREGVVIAANVDGKIVSLASGSLAGVSLGSTFALFSGRAEALTPGAAPLATGAVTAIDLRTAQITLDNPARVRRGVVRETAHAFGADTLNVRNAIPAADRSLAETALQALPFVKLAEPAVLTVAANPLEAGGAVLLGNDGTVVSDIGGLRDPQFQSRLFQDLQKVARVQALLALRTPARPAEASLCIATKAYSLGDCPPPELKGNRVMSTGRDVHMTVSNAAKDASRKLFIYVLGIDPQYAVAVLYPAPGAVDPAILPGKLVANTGDGFRFGLPGRYRFITIATDLPINADALVQTGAGARDAAACRRTALERLLCAANQGSRDPSAPRVGDWTASVSVATVVATGAKP